MEQERRTMPPIVDAKDIHINMEEIPAFRKEEFLRCIIDMVKQAFSDPAEEERYQQWLPGYLERERERKRQRELERGE